MEKTRIPVEIFPIEAILKKFPTRFFSNTIAYMIAYALLNTKTIQTEDDPLPKVVDGYNKIWFYGIDMMTTTTYIQEKGGVEFWMGIALGMGVKIINTKGSATGKTWNGRMYGHYGLADDEKKKEMLNAPWEIIRTGKSANPQTEYIKIGDEYKKVGTQIVAGQEVETCIK